MTSMHSITRPKAAWPGAWRGGSGWQSFRQPSADIHGMVEHPDDPDGLPVHIVEDAMASVGQASDRGNDFGPESAGQRVTGEQIERLAEAGEIGFADLLAPLFDAIFENGGQIGIRRGPEPDLSHAARLEYP